MKSHSRGDPDAKKNLALSQRYIQKVTPEIIADATVIQEGSEVVLDWIQKQKTSHMENS